MSRFNSIDRELALRCFDYDPIEGTLRWKHRPELSKARNTRFAGKIAGHRHTCTAGKTYIQIRVDGVLHYAHRIIWVMVAGLIPGDDEVDHQDGDGTNNRWTNLLLGTATQNKRNMRRLSTNTSGHTGVYLDKRRNTYSARVTVANQFITIASGVSFDAAVAARRRFNASNGFHPNHGSDRPL